MEERPSPDHKGLGTALSRGGSDCGPLHGQLLAVVM